LDRAGRIAGIGAWQVDLKSKKIIWNDQTCDLHGVEPGYVPTREESMAFYPMPDRLRVQEAIAAAVEEGRSWDLVVPFNNLDGEQLWVRTVGEVEFDDSGAVRLLGSLQDVTRDHLAQLKIEESRALLLEERRRLEGILDGTRAGTWEWNLATDSCIVNNRCAEMLGYDVEDLANLSITRWIQLEHPDDLPNTTARMEAYLQKKVDFFEAESRVRRKDGSWIWVLSRAKVSRWSDSEEPLWISGTYLDISERKAAELALSKTTSTLQSVLDSAVDVAVFATDLSQTITVFNKGAERMLGYDASDVVGKRNIAILFDRSQVALVRETLSLKLGREPTTQEAFDEVGSGAHGSEWNLLRKDRSLVPTSLVIAPMYGAAGEHLGYLGIGQDISRQKAYEESLRKAKIEAEQSSVAKSQFVANMSHEIRTPMNAILGMLRLLHSTPLTERQRDYADKTEGAAKSLLGILNDILDFSKVEAGKLELDPEPFLVEQLMADLSVIMSSNLGGKNVDLLFDMDPALPPCLRGDVLRIKQILINLGGNAVKFTQEGQIVIRWALAGLADGVAKIDVTVQDSGIGIAAENQAKIFEGFSQAESNTTRRFGGTGLGLAISQRLIQLMGARLVVSSELGKGSTFGFTFMLPVAEMPPAEDAVQSKVQVRTGLQVLLVDDNPVALSTSSSMMQSLGWHVSQAQTGEQALERVEQDVSGAAEHLDAIFVDWQMPGMDGWQTLRQVKRLYGERPAPALIMLSGQGRELLAKRSQRELELLNGFLVKPLTAGMFGHALMHAFDAPVPAASEESVHAARVHRLHGMRILVVEDNPINQQVAQELLKSEGADVTLADNGRLGVDAVASAQPPFDVVLMDLQMPVMDGLSAARAIRQELGLATLPVVAMTANAMASDRQACLDVGMNDHVGKPFDLTHLVEVLIRHTHWQVDATTAVAAAQLAPTPAAVQVQWPQGMDGDGALARMGGNIGLFVKTLRAFARDTAMLPDRVDALVNAGDIATARRELHGFKGLTATLGVNALSALAAKAEALAHPSDKPVEQTQQLRVLLAQIRTGVVLWMPALQALAGDLAQENETASDAPARPAADGVNLLDQLSELLEVLRNSDMQAMELHATLRQSCPDELADVFEPLDAAMAELDFEKATIECETLVAQLTQ
jgi:PAS domain S-box-containing protein